MTVPAGSWVVSLWSDRSLNTQWSVPGSVTLRTSAYTTGGGSVTAAVADSAGARTGAVDGTTATATASASRALSWSLVLAPSSAGTPPANTPPKAAFTDACTGLTCQLDAGSSTDADGTVTSWSWTFGDGGSDQGATVAHTFANAGTYDVRLVVTDDRGATDTLTRSVTVSAPPQGSTVAYVDSATRSGNLVAPAVTVPGGTQAGDTLVLNATMGNATSAAGPRGLDQARRGDRFQHRAVDGLGAHGHLRRRRQPGRGDDGRDPQGRADPLGLPGRGDGPGGGHLGDRRLDDVAHDARGDRPVGRVGAVGLGRQGHHHRLDDPGERDRRAARSTTPAGERSPRRRPTRAGRAPVRSRARRRPPTRAAPAR